MKPVAILCEELNKQYGDSVDSQVLNGIDLTIEQGTFNAIMGPSGSGKSTLLYVLAGLTPPTSAKTLSILGNDISGKSESWMATFRAKHVGFVLQFFGLIPTLSAVDNVGLAGYFGGRKDRTRRSIELLEKVGLGEHLHKLPREMSGGQKQRVAIARALINSPELLFADEPTGNLDSRTSNSVMQLLKQLNEEEGVTILLVTHDSKVATFADNVFQIEDGRLVM